MSTTDQKMIDTVIEVAVQARKDAMRGPSKCVPVFNKAIQVPHKRWPVGKPLTTASILGAFKEAMIQYGRGLECAKPTARKTTGLVEVEASAKKASGGVSLFTYTCDDFDLPLAVTQHRNIDAAQRAAKQDTEYCHVIVGRGHTPGE